MFGGFFQFLNWFEGTCGSWLERCLRVVLYVPGSSPSNSINLLQYISRRSSLWFGAKFSREICKGNAETAVCLQQTM